MFASLGNTFACVGSQNRVLPELLRIGDLCKIRAIPDQVSAQIPIIPDHELLRVIGRGAYGEIWLARTVTGAFRAVKVVYRSTFETERAFLREFEGMSAFEPISRAHAGFMNILHVGRTAEYLYYSMELSDDHLSGRRIDIGSYEPRTLKTDLARHKRLSADESIRLGLSLTEALEALQQMVDWIGKKISSSSVLSDEEENSQNLWIQGNAAFMRNWPGVITASSDAHAATAEKFQVVTLPSGPQGPSRSCLGGWNLAINNFSPNKDAAWKFIYWLLQEDAQQYLVLQW